MDKIINVLAADVAAAPEPLGDGGIAIIVIAAAVAVAACYLIFRRKR